MIESFHEVNCMLYKGVLKRVLPFFLTFAAGLFIASFFVSVVSPSSFGFPRRSHKFREMQRLRSENDELKKSNCELRKQVREMQKNSESIDLNGVDEIQTFEADAPPPPPQPRKPHRVLIDK